MPGVFPVLSGADRQNGPWRAGTDAPLGRACRHPRSRCFRACCTFTGRFGYLPVDPFTLAPQAAAKSNLFAVEFHSLCAYAVYNARSGSAGASRVRNSTLSECISKNSRSDAMRISFGSSPFLVAIVKLVQRSRVSAFRQQNWAIQDRT